MICTAINQFKKTEDFTSVGRAAKCDLFAEIEAVTKNMAIVFRILLAQSISLSS